MSLDEAAARVAARALYAQEPEFLDLFDPPVPVASPDVVPRPDGTVWFRGSKADAQTGALERWYVASGQRGVLEGLVEGRLLRERADNEHGIYVLMFDLLPMQFIVDNALPDPASVQNESLGFLRDLNGGIADQFDDTIDNLSLTPPPAAYPASWTDEEGVEHPSDRDDVADVMPTGLWSLVDFPLKWCATRVRDQGPTRGTSPAFAITGAVEARFAALRSRWLNLSEQMLHNQATGSWMPRDFGDGMTPISMLRHMRANAFTYPYESSWDYNRSVYRQELTSPPRYTRSCWLDAAGARHYGEYCSDTPHQSPIHCANHNGTIICAVDDPKLLVPPAPGVRNTTYRVVWSRFERHPFLREPDTGASLPGSLHLANLLLNLKVPLVLWCDLTPSFATATERNGLFDWDIANAEPSLGGHSMLIVGYVTRTPGGYPAPWSAGWYVCKNSWGTGWGDGGYCYLPSAWVYEHANFIFALAGVAD